MQFTLSFHLNTKTDSKKLMEFLTFWSKQTLIPLKLLPSRKKTRLLTLVKSPHVFKKSKEQFFYLIIRCARQVGYFKSKTAL
jgi:ribosomal protein S10